MDCKLFTLTTPAKLHTLGSAQGSLQTMKQLRLSKNTVSKLTIQHLSVKVGGKEILKDVSLTIRGGEVQAVMGPNGSGKSTLAYALLGHPQYQYHMTNAKCQIILNKKNITHLSTEERAKKGLFLALQSPMAIPGVSVANLLRAAYQEIHGRKRHDGENKVQNPILARQWLASDMTIAEFSGKLKNYAKILHLDESFLNRGIHDGFSGGEKKKVELLQALMLRPKFAIFDEIDTGLDVDALKVVAAAIGELAKQGTGVLVITHYQRILKYLVPRFVHVLVAGKIVKSGKARLAKEIEEEGYKKYLS